MSAAGPDTAPARHRSLVTATAAGALLCALWFVPSANASPDGGTGAHARQAVTPAAAHGAGRAPQGAGTAAPSGEDGGFGTPAALGCLVLAGTGGALALRARRRGAACASQTSSPVTD